MSPEIMTVITVTLIAAGIAILFASLLVFLKQRKSVLTELFGQARKYRVLTAAYAVLMGFFIVAYAIYLGYWIISPVYAPIVHLVAVLLFFGAVFVALSVQVIRSSIRAVLGVKLNETDTMTGLMSKNSFEMNAQKILDHGTGRYALVVMDMDRFKMINDVHGHDKGDEIIRRTAELVGANVRAGDMVGRFGGDEFVILFRNLDARGAQGIMKRIETNVVCLLMSLGCGECGGISFGAVNLVGGSGQEYHRVFAQADKALYQMKKAKRAAHAAHASH